ncbi:MAG: hypothetical protein ACJ74A_07040 [Gaiellaceae bacterium]
MTKPKAEKPPEELSEQELEAANGEPLPDREAMSVLHGVEPLPLPVIPDEPITLDDPPPGV